ncbi:MAG: ABC transporter ATP-binding protein [Chloroflexota bacterium]
MMSSPSSRPGPDRDDAFAESEVVDLPDRHLESPRPDPLAGAVLRPAPRARYGDGAVIVCDGLVRIFKLADLEVVALQGLDLLVDGGEMVAIVGASGSGKSTLLGILGGMDVPSAGRAVVAGYDLGRMNGAERTRFRRRVVGFVWQQTGRNLLPYLSAVENVELPMVLDGRSQRRQRALELLDLVGLADRATHRPDRLSGGEQQRVAIAIALANDPAVVLADEPTGELDSQTSADVFGLLRRLNKELGTTIVIVTHDAFVSEQVQRTVAIRDGRTSTETLRRTEQTDEGHHRVISEEYAVLDRAGRLQLPRSHVEALELRNRVRLRLEEDHVGVWPDRGNGAPSSSGRPAAPSGSPGSGSPGSGSPGSREPAAPGTAAAGPAVPGSAADGAPEPTDEEGGR